jgi:2-methylcitrate dehydratase PrpD
VQAYQAALDVCDRPCPDSEYAAKFSLYHCVAAALADGQVNFDSFTPEARARQAGLREKIGIAAEEPWVSAYPASWGSQVSVTCADGDILTTQRTGARGDPELALSDEEMVDKAHMLLAYAGCDRAQAQWIVEGILGLAQQDSAPEVIAYICQQLRL